MYSKKATSDPRKKKSDNFRDFQIRANLTRMLLWLKTRIIKYYSATCWKRTYITRLKRS